MSSRPRGEERDLRLPAPGIQAGPGGAAYRSHERRALGTWNTLLLADPPSGPAETDRAAEAAFRLLDRLEDELSRFRPESEVSLLNALGADRPIAVGRSLLEVLRASRRGWEATGGAFDPTVGRLMDAWGFPRGPARVPPREEIEDLLRARGMDHVVLDEEARTARFDRPGVSIDLGAVGKGYAIDRVADLLRESGVPSGAVLSGRSTIVAWGKAPDGGPWRVEVAHPGGGEDPLRTLIVEEGAVSTSGAYEDRFTVDGVEYGHILDPRTGRPVQGSLKSVTVWTPRALEGDIISTGIFVAGRAEAATLLGRLARASALLVEDDASAWGGLRADELHAGPPGFRIA